MGRKLIDIARRIDDFIIDRVLQPAVNRADWHLGLPLYSIARACAALGAGLGLIWVHAFDKPFSPDFVQDALCLLVMAGTAFLQIRAHERQAPRPATLAPAVRLTGLIWRTLWLLDLALFPSQLPLESGTALLSSFGWTVLLVLPYWLICCRRLPPPEAVSNGVFRLATIPVR